MTVAHAQDTPFIKSLETHYLMISDFFLDFKYFYLFLLHIPNLS
jgi:hypothetical protein